MNNTWIYAIGVPDMHVVKIGYTRTSVPQRLRAIRDLGRTSGLVVPASVNLKALELLYHAEAEQWMERALHHHFRRYQVCGEWFALDPAVVRREVRMAMAEIARDRDRVDGYRHVRL